MKFYQLQKGMTLLEVILVLAIASTFVAMGFRVYQGFNADRNLQQINYNVDVLFQGLKAFYSSTCSTLQVSSANPFPIVISDLVANKFIEQQWPPFQSPIVDSSSYVVQFNRSTSTRNISQCYKDVGTNVVTCSTPQEIIAKNTVLLWRLQVAVKVLDVAQAENYRAMLGANCVSSLVGSIVTPCSASPNPAGGYLVWERLPSFATPNASSAYWPSIHGVLQFKRQYTNDDFYAFTTNDITYNGGAYQNYLCGG